MEAWFGISILIVCAGVLYWALCIHGSKGLSDLLRFQSKGLFTIICLSLLSLKISPYFSLVLLFLFTYLLYKTDFLLPRRLKISHAIFNGKTVRLKALLVKDQQVTGLKKEDFLEQATNYITNSSYEIIEILLSALDLPISKRVLINVATSGKPELFSLIQTRTANVSSSDIREAIILAQTMGASEHFLNAMMAWARPRISQTDLDSLKTFLK